MNSEFGILECASRIIPNISYVCYFSVSDLAQERVRGRREAVFFVEPARPDVSVQRPEVYPVEALIFQPPDRIIQQSRAESPAPVFRQDVQRVHLAPAGHFFVRGRPCAGMPRDNSALGQHEAAGKPREAVFPALRREQVKVVLREQTFVSRLPAPDIEPRRLVGFLRLHAAYLHYFKPSMEALIFASFSSALASFVRSFSICCAGAFARNPGLFSFLERNSISFSAAFFSLSRRASSLSLSTSSPIGMNTRAESVTTVIMPSVESTFSVTVNSPAPASFSKNLRQSVKSCTNWVSTVIVTFFDGGTLMDEQNVLTSEWGEYSPQTKQSVFNYNVKLVNPQFTLTSDTLRYNTASKIADIVGPSDIWSDANHIYSEKGIYNTVTGKADLYNRSVLTNQGKQLTGDSLFYDRNTGIGEAFSRMVMTDTINRNMMTGEYGFYNEKTGYAFATDSAVAIDYSQGDSLFLHADTLLMETFHLNTDSMFREMRAFHKVRFYRTDVQGTADSLVFSTVDSCLTMYRDPIIWNKNQQLLGEVIKVYMNDSTIDWSHIIGQALSVERIDSVLYNQVTGKEMKSYFEGGDMRKTEVIGSVRVVYYPMDSDSTLIGMNVSETSKLEIYLQDRKIERMVMSPKSNGVLYPMSQIPAGKDRLENFVWFDYIRPLNKADIFNWRGKRVEDQLKKNVRGPVVLPNAHLFENKKEE